MDSLYISNIGYYIGEPYSISAIKDADEEQLSVLNSIGLKNFCQSPKSIETLCYESIKLSLKDLSIDRKEVDAIIIAATVESIHETGIDFKIMDKAIFDLGLTNAFIFGSTLSKCSNLSTALELASALIKANAYKNVIVVVADKYNIDINRIMQSNEAVLSDGAASLLLSKNKGTFKLKHLEIKNDIGHINKTYNLFDFLKSTATNVNSLWENLKLKQDGTIINKFFTGNYNLLVQRSLVGQLKIPKSKFYLDNIPKIGHVFSADVLINLKHYLEQEPSSKGAHYACFTIGYFRWGLFILEKIE